MSAGTFVYSNHYLAQRNKGAIDWENNAIQCIIMATGFTFNPDTHATYADVSASELANGNGYTTGGKTLQNVAVSEDDTNNRSDVTADPDVWTASGGSIGPFAGFLYYDDTTADDTVIGYLPVSPEETATDGNDINLTHPTFRST